ncbi:hypothetical protein [Rhizobium sp. RAF56]|uniref:hypothetical protein n=1 Tax=Rhizobium sp. RAF56 TaxID=3233062 RepID=UPI003F94FCB7
MAGWLGGIEVISLCEKLRYEAIENPSLLATDVESRITITLDEEKRQLVIEDNGVGMSHDEKCGSLFLPKADVRPEGKLCGEQVGERTRVCPGIERVRPWAQSLHRIGD